MYIYIKSNYLFNNLYSPTLSLQEVPKSFQLQITGHHQRGCRMRNENLSQRRHPSKEGTHLVIAPSLHHRDTGDTRNHHEQKVTNAGSTQPRSSYVDVAIILSCEKIHCPEHYKQRKNSCEFSSMFGTGHDVKLQRCA